MLAYARSVSPVSYLDKVKAPTLIVQGQADTLFNLNEATATYRTLKAQGTETKMIWQSWGHSGGQVPGELDLSQGNLETSHVGQRVLAWFDRHLRGNTAADTGPALSYYRDCRAATEPPPTSRPLAILPPLRRRHARRQPLPGGARQPPVHQLAGADEPFRRAPSPR